MEKRIFAAIAISIVFLYLWAFFAPRLFPQLAKPEQPAAKASTPATAPPANGTTGSTYADTAAASTATGVSPAAPGATPVKPASPSRPVVPISAKQIVYSVVETEHYIARFSNRGAQLVSFRLNRYKAKDGSLVELVKAREPSRVDFPFAIESRDYALSKQLNSALYAVDDRIDRGVRVLAYHYVGPDGLSATKTFRIAPDYQFEFATSVTPAIPYRVIVGPGIRTLGAEEHDNRIIITGDGVVQVNGKFQVLGREKGDRLRIYDQPDYIGIEDNYFLSVLKPSKGGAAILRRIDLGGTGKESRKELYAGLNAATDGVVAGTAFFGPKETKLLDRYGFAETLQFGYFGIIARFLLDALVWLNKFTKNYGFAIIVLTILIKVVLYPLQHKSIVSMKKMQRVQPKMDVIKNRYKKAKTDPDQRQKMNVEMMKLYQVEGINPMSGCVPILLQLPILWGFYGLLSRAIELRGAPFIVWIHDLSEKDPYYITPILMMITMFIQTWITPTTGDPAQRKMFLAMPLVFGIMFKEMASGLVLYWLVQNVLTIIQQSIMNKWWKDHPKES